MSDLQPFDFQGQSVRVVTDEYGEPWFFAIDVCRVLDIKNTGDAMSRLAVDEKGVGTADTHGGVQQVTTVSEAGLYRLVFTSRRPEAESFRRWVTHEVLPAIRRTGTYSTSQQVALPTTRELALMVVEAEDARLAAEARVAELEPKAEFAEKLLSADGDLSVGDTAKALNRAGVKVGADRLFRALADRKWLFRPADGRWRVYQSAIETGWMSVLPQSHYHPRTGVLVLDPPQPRVTPKGLQRLLTDHGVEKSAAAALVTQVLPAQTLEGSR